VLRFVTGRLRRYGRAAGTFGTPLSLRGWLAAEGEGDGEGGGGVLALPRPQRLPHMQRLADEMLERIKAIIPVTPVALASAALLSFERDTVPLADLLRRMADYRDHLVDVTATVVRADRDVAETWNRARLMFDMRRTVVAAGDTIVILARQRPLLEYYANSIRHLLPRSALPEGQLLSPAVDAVGIADKYRLQNVR